MREELLENRITKLEWRLRVSVLCWVIAGGAIVMSAWLWSAKAQQSTPPTSLRVTELVVLDSKGVERVRIGGELPDALIGGKKVPRGQKAADVILYDGLGQERSGYVTFEPSGNVGLTLDSNKSQVAYFIAGRDSGSALQMWEGRDTIELRSDLEGSRLSAMKGGQMVVQQPEITRMSADMCEVYKTSRSRVSAGQVMVDCKRRFTDPACEACLGKPQ
jgi:hypothetical protein